MFRANRMTPPSPNSRASDLQFDRQLCPSKPAISSWPIWRRSAARRHDVERSRIRSQHSRHSTVNLRGRQPIHRPSNSPCDRLVRADAHRPGRRHDRHLAAVSLPRRRVDAERGDQPARARRDRVADRRRASSCARSTPIARSRAARWSELDGDRRAAAAGAAGAALPARERDADDARRIAGRRRHRRIVGADHRRLRRARALDRRVVGSRATCCRSR